MGTDVNIRHWKASDIISSVYSVSSGSSLRNINRRSAASIFSPGARRGNDPREIRDKKKRANARRERAESANRTAAAAAAAARDTRDKYCVKSAGRKTRGARIFVINVRRYHVASKRLIVCARDKYATGIPAVMSQ